jgi:hypothetical protein
MSKTSRTLATMAGTLALVPTVLLADGPKFSGFVTGSYIYDINDPPSGFVNGAGSAPGSTYTNFYGGRNASFKADAAHLTITGGDSAGASYTIDLDAGTDGIATGGALWKSSTGFAFDVQQAFVSLPFGKSAFGLQAGKFYTSEGIEVGNSAANPTVTRGLAFGVLEFTSSTGAVLTFKANDQISGAIGAINEPNSATVWQMDGSDGIPVGYAKVALAYGDPFSATISAYYGPQGGYNLAGDTADRKMYTSLDLTGLNKTLIPSVDLNFQGNFMWKDKSVLGATYTAYLFGLQPLYHMGAGQIGLRYEFLSVDQGTTVMINSVALAPGYKLTQNTLIRAEYRIDYASKSTWYVNKNGNGTDVDQVVGGEVNYTF